MTNTQTTKTNHYHRMLVALAMLTTVVSLLVAATATNEFTGDTSEFSTARKVSAS